MRSWQWLVLSFALCIGAYAAYGVATSDSPWSEVLFTLVTLMRFEPPWFDMGDSAARVVSALAFWASLASFLALAAGHMLRGCRSARR